MLKLKTHSLSRPLSLTMVLLTVLALFLVACGDNTATTTPATTTAAATTASGAQITTAAGAQTTAAAATTAAVTGPVVDLTVWMAPGAPEGAAPPADWEAYKIIKEKLNINLKFTMTPVGNDGDTKLSAAAASNNLPDLFQMTNRTLFYQFADQGLLGPTTQLLPSMPERSKLRYSNDNLNKLVTVNGAMLGLQEPAQLYKRNALFIRQDWLDKLGLKAPTTLDEFYEVAKAFTEKDPDGNGKNDTFGFGSFINGPNGLGINFDFIYGAYGLPGLWSLSPDKFGLAIRDPNYQKATEYVKKLIDAKIVDPDWPTLKLDDLRSRWKQGKYGIFVEDFCAAMCQANYKGFDANNPKGNLVILDPPKGPDGKNATSTFAPVGTYYAVSKKAIDGGKGPAIARLLEWANSGEGYFLLGFGKEGVNYKFDATKNIDVTGIKPELVYSSKEQQPILQMKTMAYIGTDVELRARYVLFQTGDGRNIDPLDYYKKSFNEPNLDATAVELIKAAPNQADISRYVSEGLVQFVLGQKPLNSENWNSYVKGLDGLGVSDWEAAAKKSLQGAGFLK